MQRERVSCQVVALHPFCGWNVLKAHWVKYIGHYS